MATDRPVGRVCVLGLGLMGGSLCRALSSLDLAREVVGWSPEGTERAAALTAGAVSEAPETWREAVASADLVVLAAPLQGCLSLMGSLPGAMPAHATLSDVASLKGPVASAAREAGLTDRWVGSHPMAGAESSGFWSSRADLYEGATVWLISDEGGAVGGEGPSEERIRALERLWRGMGARPRRIEAVAHDRLMALASHLPQLSANALARTLGAAGLEPSDLGPGGRDATRLAGSNPEMWTDLFRHADPALLDGLRSLARELGRLADLLETGAVERLGDVMVETRAWKTRS
jgi:prephenate dehydrogenase